jgi:transcriptional regulator with XRE-family HTH domain
LEEIKKMSFLQIIDDLIKKSNITRAELLRFLGLSHNSFKNWENGSIPAIDSISKIADYFNVTTDYLLGRTDKPQSNAPPLSPTAELTPEETEILNLYRALDHRGRSRITTIAYEEQDRLKFAGDTEMSSELTG